MKILLVAEESAGIGVLRLLVRSPHQIVGVVTSRAARYGGPLTMWKVAEALGYRIWPAERLKEATFPAELSAEGVDVLLNVHSLYILGKEILRLPDFGCFNLHPGPLPRYAGLNPVCWAIYNGEATHGVSLHRMLEAIDAGPIVYQTTFPIEANDTGLSVSLRCIKQGLELISRLIEILATNPASLPEKPQDLTHRKYFGRQIPHDGQVVWSLPAREILNFVRACDFHPFASPWGYPQARKGACEFSIVKAAATGHAADAVPGTVGRLDGAGVVVASADEWISVSKVMLAGKLLDSTELLQAGDRLDSGP